MSAATEYQARYAEVGWDEEKVRALRLRLRVEKLALADEAYHLAKHAHADVVSVRNLARHAGTLDTKLEHRVENAEQLLADATRNRDRAVADAVAAL